MDKRQKLRKEGMTLFFLVIAFIFTLLFIAVLIFGVVLTLPEEGAKIGSLAKGVHFGCVLPTETRSEPMQDMPKTCIDFRPREMYWSMVKSD